MPNYKEFDLDIQNKKGSFNPDDTRYTKKFPRSECECYSESKQCEIRTISVCGNNC